MTDQTETLAHLGELLRARLARADRIEAAARRLLDTTDKFRDTPPCSADEKRAIAKNRAAEAALRAALEAS